MTRALISVLCIASLCGCDSNELGLVPVRGTITFNGAPPPAEGRISFTPREVAPGKPRRMASAEFESDGRFSASSFKPGDGLVPGTYAVRVSCLSGQITDSMTRKEIDEVSHVPRGFEAPQLVIEPGSDAVTYDLDVTKSGS